MSGNPDLSLHPSPVILSVPPAQRMRPPMRRPQMLFQASPGADASVPSAHRGATRASAQTRGR